MFFIQRLLKKRKKPQTSIYIIQTGTMALWSQEEPSCLESHLHHFIFETPV